MLTVAVWTGGTDSTCSSGQGKAQRAARARMAQGRCAVSILGSFPDSTGSSPEQPGLPGFEQEVGQRPPEVPSSPSYPLTRCHGDGTFCIHQSAHCMSLIFDTIFKTSCTYAKLFHCRRYDPRDQLGSSSWLHEQFPHAYTTGDLAQNCAL